MVKQQNQHDLYQTVTDRIVAAIEAGAPSFEMPWHSYSAGTLPVNALTKKTYRGINVLSLWVAQMAGCYRTGIWGTYKQWQECGAQVRKGEKASLVVFYKQLEREVEDAESDEARPGKFLLARSSSVFNADQVDGHAIPALPKLEDKTEAVAQADEFLRATGATVIYGGDSAFYRPRTDTIYMPERNRFTGTKTSTATEAFYSTLLHETVHWTAAEGRTNRNLSKRFGDEAYAMEELIAELGAAFLCAGLGITAEPRGDHAAYLDHWLQVMKADKKALFTAASKASQAVDFLHSLQPQVREEAA
jgi:antirestriction protein ArdC